MSDKAITVGQLIEQLKALPQDLPVASEGCDCTGEASGAELDASYDGTPYVLIKRL